jgi:signal peptidase II
VFNSNYKLLGWSVFVVLLDQWTKRIVSQSLSYGASINVIGDFVRITFIKNPGMAFGIQLGNKLFFTIFSLIASIVIVIYLFRLKPENFWARFALASILGGAIGNLIDRVVYSEVIDFIDFRFIRWPVFNVADIAVTLGMILLIAFVLLDNKNAEYDDEQLEMR